MDEFTIQQKRNLQSQFEQLPGTELVARIYALEILFQSECFVESVFHDNAVEYLQLLYEEMLRRYAEINGIPGMRCRY